MKILDILILVGAIQGFISTVLLFRVKGQKQTSARLLASLILLFSLACLNLYLMQIGIRYEFRMVDTLAYFVPLLIVMPAGPLIYFYIRSLTEKDFQLRPFHYRHFYPIILDLLPYLIGAVLVIGLSIGAVSSDDKVIWMNFINAYNAYVDIPRWLSMAAYTGVAGVQLLSRVRHSTFRQYWPVRFIFVLAVFGIIWLSHLIPYIIPAAREVLMPIVSWYPIYIPLALLVYWLGISGFLVHMKAIGVSRQTQEILPGNEQARVLHERLLEAMENERLFLDPLLTVTRLADHLNVPQKQLSALINQQLGRSFNELVNTYRVNELKKRLSSSKDAHLTIMGLALECGFNSQATMQRTFKQLTGLSPREFQQAHSENAVSI